MKLPDKGSPDRLEILRKADIDELLALSYEEMSDMSVEELRLISARFDEQIRENDKKIEKLRAKLEKGPEDTVGGMSRDKRGPYFTERKHENREYLHQKQRQNEEVQQQKEKIRTLELKSWAQDDRFRDLMMQYQCAIKDVRTRLEIIGIGLEKQHHRHFIRNITDRIKEPESIQRKLMKKEKPVEIDTLLRDNPLYDIAGIRVICAFQDDVYRIEDLLKGQDGITILGGDRRKDYIKEPKESGYRSLHLIVKVPVCLGGEVKDTCVEVQIRTLAMDFWSSLEHGIQYKHTVANQTEVSKGLLACAEDIAALDNEMMRLRDLAREEK